MAKLETLTDRFEGSALRTPLWSQFTGGGATFTYDITGAAVVYPVSTTSTTDGDLTTIASYDLTASYAFLNVTSVPNVGAPTSTDARFLVGTVTNGLAFLVENGSIFAQKFVASAQTNITSTAYNATTHAWWRIREGAGTTFWETSSDGLVWTTFTSQANPITVTSLTVQLAGTAFGSSSSPGSFKFRSFNIPPSFPQVNTFRPGISWINHFAKNERHIYSYPGPLVPAVNASIAQVAATLTFTGGTQVIATTSFASITQVAATITFTGGTQTATTNSSNAQVAATITFTGGTQTVATVRNVAISQLAATITFGGGTQVIATINNVSLTQLAATITFSGGTQVVTSIQKVAIAQLAGTVTFGGGTQSIATVRSLIIAQLAATLTFNGGTQVTLSSFSVALAQVGASLTLGGGVQSITATNIIPWVSPSIILQSGAKAAIVGGGQAVVTTVSGAKSETLPSGSNNATIASGSKNTTVTSGGKET